MPPSNPHLSALLEDITIAGVVVTGCPRLAVHVGDVLGLCVKLEIKIIERKSNLHNFFYFYFKSLITIQAFKQPSVVGKGLVALVTLKDDRQGWSSPGALQHSSQA